MRSIARRVLGLAAAAGMAGCGPSAPTTTTPGQKPLSHDFGAVRHGLTAEARLEVTLPGGIAGHYPRGATVGCPCVTYSFEIADAAGRTREANFAAVEDKTVRPGERLLLVLKLDTNRKEPADLPRQRTQGFVLIQDPKDPIEQQQRLPLEFWFAIDAPVEVRPFAHVDMGRVPRKGVFRQTLELAGDANHPGVKLGPARTTDPRLSAVLHPGDGAARLDLEFRPNGSEFIGPMPPMGVLVQTDLPGTGVELYAVAIPVTGRILPPYELEPPNGIHFERIDLAAEHASFANVLDHELDEPKELELFAIKDPSGNSLAKHFEVQLEPVADRITRVRLRYLGTLPDAFRGTIELTRRGRNAPAIQIDFRAHKLER